MRRYLSVMLALALALGLLLPVFGGSQIANAASGGPDTFGYRYIDSAEAGGPAFSWIDIAAPENDTGLTNDDQGVQVPIGFTFNLYGNSYTQIVVSSNGYLTFGGDWTDCGNDCIPNNTDPNDIICPFWDDIDIHPEESCGEGVQLGRIYYQTQGTEPNRRFIAEWYDVPHISDDECSPERSHLTFEAILYEGSNNIKFQYLSMRNGGESYADGRSATVGIENSDASDGLEYSCKTSSIYDELAICVYPPGSEPCTSPSPVPTLSEWGIIGMAVLFAGGLAWTVRRRRQTSAAR